MHLIIYCCIETIPYGAKINLTHDLDISVRFFLLVNPGFAYPILSSDIPIN